MDSLGRRGFALLQEASYLAERADRKEAIVQKDRFIFAIIIYGLILLAGAGVCSVLLPGDISAVANIGTEGGKEVTPTPDVTEPTQPVVPTKEPEQSTNDVNENGDMSENQNPSEQVKPNDKAPGETVNDGDETHEIAPEEEVVTGAWALLSANTTAEWREIIGKRCIVLRKPEAAFRGQTLLFSLTEMPVEQSIAVKIFGCANTEYGYDAVERIAGEQYFGAEVIPGADTDANGTGEAGLTGTTETASGTEQDPLRRLTWSCTPQEDGSYLLYAELLLDKTYVYNVYETETHYFIALKEAKEVYDRVVVLDAGHGGWDTGTPSKNGTVLEKNINLQVLLYLEELLAAEDIKVYATRTTDRYIGHTERIALANALKADLFLSIHCSNANPEAEKNGTEVLYTQHSDSETGIKAERLALLCQEELVAALQLKECGLQAGGDELTVLQKAEVPAAQVELALLSNGAEMNLLKTEEAQRAAAEALYRAVMRAYEEMAAE